jgi:diguanylate cyclase (GGDEF)-like protein
MQGESSHDGSMAASGQAMDQSRDLSKDKRVEAAKPRPTRDQPRVQDSLEEKKIKAQELPLYNLVSRMPGPRSFPVRIFMLSFIGTQLPMFILLLYVVMNVEMNAEILTTVSIVLITSLLGSASTIIALVAYAEPVNAIGKAVHNFAYSDSAPDLPENYKDEIGELMANTQGALKKLHSMLHNMHELSIRDELTGLYNRRFFSEQADMLLIRSMRYEEPLTLIFIDIDDFKAINDEHSHQVGDHALRQIATILSDTARGSDLTARLGGDEFVLVLPNTPLIRARQICERLRSNLEKHDWSSLLPGTIVSASIGMAEAQEYDTLEKLMDRADANLFRAKKSGRNQIQA